MNHHPLAAGTIRAISNPGANEGYMPGFGNDFETEALPGALPQGQNSPQKCSYGLYAEQLSGTAFTAPRGQNERTWCYRIRPRVKHTARFQQDQCSPLEIGAAYPARRNLSWPVPLGSDPAHGRGADMGDRHATMTTAGDVNTQTGMARHVYLVTQSMVDEYFYSADSELLVVPQEGRLRFCTELGVIDLEPKEIAILPRGLVYRVEVLEGPCARLRLRKLWPEVRSAQSRPDRRQLPGQSARFQMPCRGFRGSRGALAGHHQMVWPIP